MLLEQPGDKLPALIFERPHDPHEVGRGIENGDVPNDIHIGALGRTKLCPPRVRAPYAVSFELNRVSHFPKGRFRHDRRKSEV